jgi:hypothetical protein
MEGPMQHLYQIAGVRFGLFVAMVIAIGWLVCRADEESMTLTPGSHDGFAVVELFTSEGCSSCPPADVLLGKIAEEAKRRQINVFPIAFHIDYWDGLGWKDRFSLADATERQQRYAGALGSDLYTPQMVVNGRVQFLGSDADAARRAIDDALATAPAAHLKLDLAKSEDRTMSIAYQASDVPPGSVLNLVIIQRSATTDVPRGENAGRTLHHVNIVRSIKTIPLNAASGHASLELPGDLDAKDATVIGFVQDPVSMRIIAAARVGNAS